MESNDEEVKLLFLLSASHKTLPSSYIKLRSYLNIHSSQVADNLGLKLPKQMTAKSVTCPYCYTSWNNSSSPFKLAPGKKWSSEKRLRKRLGKLEKDFLQSNPRRNTMILNCKICRKISKLSLTKKPKSIEVKDDIIVEEVCRKKKKKKDKSCGIKIGKAPELKKSNNIQKKKNEFSCQKNTLIKAEHSAGHKPPQKVNKPNAVAINPFATKVQKVMSNKEKKRLKDLQEGLKQDKSSARKTLEGFLSLVRS